MEWFPRFIHKLFIIVRILLIALSPEPVLSGQPVDMIPSLISMVNLKPPGPPTIQQQQQLHRPRGIFIQVSLAKPTDWVYNALTRWLDNICARNLQLPPDQRMDDLVLLDIASEQQNAPGYVIHHEPLAKIDPYFPGGSKSCFANLFVGTLNVVGPEPIYDADIRDPNFRQKNIDLSRAVGQEFKKKYPNTIFHWYITYESNLNYFYDERIRAGYEDLLTRLIKVLTSINKGSIMWSPAFWDPWSKEGEDKIRGNLNLLFVQLYNNANPGIDWINLQDKLGGLGSPPGCGLKITQEDVISWFRFLKSVYNFKSIQMNEELFKFAEPPPGSKECGIVENEASVQVQREETYRVAGVPLGAAFEIRYWRERG